MARTKEEIIAAYLRQFRCEINQLHAIADKLNDESKRLDFLRMTREYAWIIGDTHATMHQIFQYIKFVQDLAEMTGQHDEPLAKRPKTPKTKRAAVIERDGQTCQYCGRTGSKRRDPDGEFWHVDHMTPVIKGGSSELNNLTLSCARCNLDKRTMTAEEYRAVTTAA